MQLINPKDQPGSSIDAGAHFTGEVHTYMAMAPTGGVSVNNVSFTPSARTHWHSHERGQVLVVLAGRGLVQSEGEQARTIRGGDTVWAGPGERHWHGASPDSYVVHTAISLGTTDWSGPVDDADYAAPPGD